MPARALAPAGKAWCIDAACSTVYSRPRMDNQVQSLVRLGEIEVVALAADEIRKRPALWRNPSFIRGSAAGRIPVTVVFMAWRCAFVSLSGEIYPHPIRLPPNAQLDCHLGLGVRPCFCGGTTGRVSSYLAGGSVIVRLRDLRRLYRSFQLLLHCTARFYWHPA